LGRIEAWPQERQLDAAHILILMENRDAHTIGLTDAQVAEVECLDAPVGHPVRRSLSRNDAMTNDITATAIMA
jgi:hypothetical protein